MTFELLKKLGGSKAAKQAAEPDAGKDKSDLRGLDFESQSKALKPPEKDEKKKGGGVLGSIKSALGIKDKKGGRAPDAAAQAAAEDVLEKGDSAAALAGNIMKRVPQMLSELAGNEEYFPEAISRSGELVGRAGSIVSCHGQLVSAFHSFQKNGDLAAFKAAADALLQQVIALRIALSGLAGPGDSIAVSGLILPPALSADIHVKGGIVLGDKDKAKHGDTRNGPAGKGVVGGASQLPTALHSVSGEAIRMQGKHFMEYADMLRAAVQALG